MTSKHIALFVVGAAAGTLVLGKIQSDTQSLPAYDTWSPEARSAGKTLYGAGALGLLFLMAGGK